MSERPNKKVFTFRDVEYAVHLPTPEDQNAAQSAYNRAFRKAVDSGAILRPALSNHLQDQNIWSEKMQERETELQKIMYDSELRLRKGGITLEEGRKLALAMSNAREELVSLRSVVTEADIHTAEAQAEQARFNFLIARCTVNNDDGKMVFKDTEDYLTKINGDGKDHEFAALAAENFAQLAYNLQDDFQKKLPENAFLLRYGYMDEELRLVDRKDGHLVDEKGRRVNEDGLLINEDGKVIDVDGNVIEGITVKDGEAEWNIETKPFLDEDGQSLDNVFKTITD